MFDGIRKKILDHVDRASLMQQEVKSLARRKIERLQGSFVGSDIYFNVSLLESRYQGVRTSTFILFINVPLLFMYYGCLYGCLYGCTFRSLAFSLFL